MRPSRLSTTWRFEWAQALIRATRHILYGLYITLGFMMSANTSYGLEQARIQLPSIVADAHAGVRCIITKHGKPYAAIVPLEDVQRSSAEADLAPGLLALRGTGRGLWGADVGQTVSELRDEWGEA